MSAVVRGAASEEQQAVLPKNFSNEGDYHQKYYYPRLALQNMERRERFAKFSKKKPAGGPLSAPACETTTNGFPGSSSGASLDSEEDFRVPSLSDSDTANSEGGTPPPQSPSASDGASASSITESDFSALTLVDDGKDEDHGDPVISQSAKRIVGKQPTDCNVPPKIQLDMDESKLADPLPSPIQDIPDYQGHPLQDMESPGEGPCPEEDRGGLFEDREFDFLKTERPRRSTSLKTYKTPPGTPSRKKGVRFADALGLDLESVRHILNLDSPPKIPDYAVKDLQVGLEEEHKTEGARYLSAIFSQPGARPDFVQRVLRDKVALENCLVDDKSMTVTGTVRVANLSYHKQVTIRTSLNGWLTHEDIPATYVVGSHDTLTDRFSFTITVPYYFNVGNRLEFCIKFLSEGEWWDNNYGSNYAVVCYAKNVPVSQHGSQNWVHFL